MFINYLIILQERLEWASRFFTCMADEWSNVIWTDECGFNVGGSLGRVYVTRKADEEYDDSCLLPRFKKLETIHVWGCFMGKKKGPLIIWDRATMGKTIKAAGYCTHIVPHLEQF